VLVLDERFLLERVTRGLYWLVTVAGTRNRPDFLVEGDSRFYLEAVRACAPADKAGQHKRLGEVRRILATVSADRYIVDMATYAVGTLPLHVKGRAPEGRVGTRRLAHPRRVEPQGEPLRQPRGSLDHRRAEQHRIPYRGSRFRTCPIRRPDRPPSSLTAPRADRLWHRERGDLPGGLCHDGCARTQGLLVDLVDLGAG
jgi:hypothetical protein